MTVEIRSLVFASLLAAAAGSVATLAIQKAAGTFDVRDAEALPRYEDQFIHEFELPESDRKLVRSILYKYRDRRRAIEGRSASKASKELSDLGRTIDAELCAILPPDRQTRYNDWLARR
ncbi:MAG: hypothetical protein ACKVS6_09605 [Planctomycetota bacterium]